MKLASKPIVKFVFELVAEVEKKPTDVAMIIEYEMSRLREGIRPLNAQVRSIEVLGPEDE
jgi:hypothetical protein